MIRVSVLMVGLLLAAASAVFGADETCARGRPREADKELIFPFFGMGFAPSFPSNVTIHFGPSFREVGNAADLARGAIDKWRTACSSSLPVSFQVKPDDPRPIVNGPLDDAYRTTMVVKVDKDSEVQVRSTGIVLGGWTDSKNEIILPGRCPRSGTYGLPCAGPGLPIDWGRDRRWTTQILAHELGHAMGLGHDGEGGSCNETIMKTVLQPGVTYRVEPRHWRCCRKV